MASQLILALSICAIPSVAAQKFSAFSPSFQAPDGESTWSWSSFSYTPSSWPTQTHLWSTSTYVPETWTSAAWSPSPSPSPPSAPPSWPTTTHSWEPSSSPPETWTAWPTSSHGWPASSVPPHTWSSWPSSSYAWPSPTPSPSLPSLNDALIAAGAAQFAALIQSDPVVSAGYVGVPAVFAPTDEFLGSNFSVSRLRRRATLTPAQQQQLLLHASQDQSEINGLRTPPGKVVTTKDSKANLNGTGQKVVSDTRNKTKSTNGKRWAPAILPRQDATTNVTTLVNIFAGLGNSIGIITGDIPFDGGFIHTTDGLFTVPLPLSQTAQSTGETTFVSLTNVSGQTIGLDATPSITAFIPTNDAFAASNISTASTGLASIISAHVLQDFVGYIPALTNGSTFITQAGSTVTVTIQGDDYYINNAKILSSNLILENGVAHVIDSVLELPIAPYTGAASFVLPPSLPKTIALYLCAAMSLAWLL